MNDINRWWTEIWSSGSGSKRLYCGIARTEEGFAVDVFRGDTCIDSRTLDSRDAAVKAASTFERRHARDTRSAAPARGEMTAH